MSTDTQTLDFGEDSQLQVCPLPGVFSEPKAILTLSDADDIVVTYPNAETLRRMAAAFLLAANRLDPEGGDGA